MVLGIDNIRPAVNKTYYLRLHSINIIITITQNSNHSMNPGLASTFSVATQNSNPNHADSSVTAQSTLASPIPLVLNLEHGKKYQK